jgi:hypothetical protein
MKKLRPELQVTSTECGLCCAAMVLHAQGCKDPTAQLREELDLISPRTFVDEIGAYVFTMHGVGDDAIPITHAYELNDALPAEADQSHLNLLSHRRRLENRDILIVLR